MVLGFGVYQYILKDVFKIAMAPPALSHLSLRYCMDNILKIGLGFIDR